MRTSKPDELSAILQQLIPMGLHPDLDDLIQNMLPDSTPNERLQLKMQLRELHTPCLQPIDLRNRVDGRCYEHHILGLTHWLDDIALNLFNQQLELYQQHYTRGVYDAVMQAHNNFKVLHQKKQQHATPPAATTNESSTPTAQPAEHKKLPVKVARFGYQFMRNEIRLLYHSQVLITLLETQYLVHGITLDISLAGLCVRVPHAVAFKLGQEL
ncbi:MAG: PilZ domain-containing protein, partial [Plesiomonas sp.]